MISFVGTRPALPKPAATDPRLEPRRWDAGPSPRHVLRVRLLALAALPLVAWYFSWLLRPERVGHSVLYGLLVAAELFNLVQALGFWWTCASERPRRASAPPAGVPGVDVFIPTYGEPVDIVEPTVAAACAMRSAHTRVAVLDDGDNDDMRDMAGRLGARYIRRAEHTGAKAGNLNHALGMTHAPFVAVFDADHVPDPRFLERTMQSFDDRTALVQTPQYYANGFSDGVAAAAWSQQALFFGAIARGKDGLGATFCCGTNVVFRRSALADAGGFPERSLTEDFELSVRLHERGWRTAYVPEVLASGLGPDDMAAYVGQQHRWARGCLDAIPRVLRSRLPLRQRVQYLLSSMYFLSGWTFLVYMTFPVVRLLTGRQPVAAATADQFLLHFLPYYAAALGAVAVAGGGAYTFHAFVLAFANYWVHIHASLRALFRRPGRFVVTPKSATGDRQVRAVAPALAAVAVLLFAASWGLARGHDPGTLNNVAFAGVHIGVLLAGAWPALRGRP